MPSDIWTIQAALDWTIGDLERNDESNPRLAAQWLLSAATGLERIELYTNYDKPLSDSERAKLRGAIERRRTGEPLQYILGKAPFRRLELVVRPGVLIPRPETEVLVDVVLGKLRGASAAAASMRVLDLCTGSGCIALSLVSEYADCLVTATDIEPVAVELARENAGLFAADDKERLDIRLGDLAAELLQDETNHGSYDVVVSNPPYVPTELLENLPQEVAVFEPTLALDGGADGLDIYRRIVEQALILLKPGGLLACELHEDCLDQAVAVARQAGFEQVEVHDDLAQRPRFIMAWLPNAGQPRRT